MFVPEHSTCVRSFIFKLRPPSGAVNGGVKQSERRGGPWGGVFPLRGLEARSCLSAGRLPALQESAPVPPVIRSCSSPRSCTPLLSRSGVAPPTGGVRATSPQGEYPTP